MKTEKVVSGNPKSFSDESGAGGHRARLLDRYVNSGASALHDYELLELLLTFALPRRDTKPIAKKLIAKYGAISAVINAPADELCETCSLTERSAALFSLVKDISAVCLSEKYVKKPIIKNSGHVEEYLRFNFGHLRNEYAAAVFLDGAGHIIGTDVIAEGIVNRCAIFPRQIIERALKRGAASFIFAHNHPAGVAQPSEDDWLLTECLKRAGNSIDLPLLDHLIITKDAVVSLKKYERWQYIG